MFQKSFNANARIMSLMVDFKELRGNKKIIKSTDPLEIFKNLDKPIEKEYLWPPQEGVLKAWNEKHRDKKDVIVKLHTGQGKTMIGLLMLQSILNENKGPALYICPNNYLVDQIIKEARSYSIKTTKFNGGPIPQSFSNSEAILVTNCNKLFNGKSVFGVRGNLDREIVQIGAIVVDDAHKCLDIIRHSFSISVKRSNELGTNPIYDELWNLFEDSLRTQAAGTCTDIVNGSHCLIAVPFWTWHEKVQDVLQILFTYKEINNDIKFSWDLLKDHLDGCICIFSGDDLEISPRLLPIDAIPSFTEAERRIFLSATLNEDSFLVKDMGISSESVLSPLSQNDVNYSGERLIILPSLVDPSLQRGAIISWAQRKAAKNGSFGMVAIVPSSRKANDWKDNGAELTNVNNLYEKIESLKLKIKDHKASSVLVLLNEYDGVDLPGDTCRILILDSLPSYTNLVDDYLQQMDPFSGNIRRQLAQRVEQGMGRAIRGSSDWCVVVVVGDDITNFLSEKSKLSFLSPEAQLQIAIANELIPKLKAEGGKMGAIDTLVNQSLVRDEEWKAYYREQMSELKPGTLRSEHLERAKTEREAELLYRQGQFRKAADTLYSIVGKLETNDRAYVLQLVATYLYPINVEESMDKQLKAHQENPSLFRPPTGINYSKVKIGGTRANRIITWLKEHDSPTAVNLEVKRITQNLSWGIPSESFEEAIKETGTLLGLVSERPEKKTGKGPDNLWHIQGKMYWLIECKNRVKLDRPTISKVEGGQLNTSIVWFKEKYENEENIAILVHPAHELDNNAFIDGPFWVLTPEGLKRLSDNITKFYNALGEIPFDNLTAEIIAQKLKANELDIEGLLKNLQHGCKQT